MRRQVTIGFGAAFGILSAAGAAGAATINSSGVFASSPAGATGPDSITDLNGSIYIAYAGGTDSQSGAGTSTIVRYSAAGAVQQTYSLTGSVDGLKANPSTGQIWALQNQDGNARLSLINPVTNSISGPLSYGAPYVYGASSTRGYDDVAFKGSQVFLSLTNPTAGTDPIVQTLDQGNTPSGTLTTTNVVFASQTGVPTPDIDSLKTTPNGSLVITDGDGGRFTVVTNPGTPGQTATAVQITDASGAAVSGVDDVLFPGATSGTLYVTGTSSNTTLALNVSGLDPATPIVSIGSLGELATVNTATGLATAFFSSPQLRGPHGLDLVVTTAASVPEPASLALLGAGLLGIAGLRSRRV